MKNLVRIDELEVIVQEDPMTVGIQKALDHAAKIPARKNTIIDKSARDNWNGWDKCDETAIHADMSSMGDED